MVAMPERIYFDTSAFREIGKAFESNSLDSGLKKNILISPITLFEVWSQLTVEKADEILRQIHAVRNWIEPQHAGLLPWPDAALSSIWFRKPAPDNGYREEMENALNTCLTEDSPERLREEAGRLRDAIDKMNEQSAENFGRLLEAAREAPLEGMKFSDAWFKGIAKRVNADPRSRSVEEIIQELSAYHEFEEIKLRTALQHADYNPAKHVNDLLDAEQLVYLNDHSLCFLTCDKGFAKLSKSPQAERIVLVPPTSLCGKEAIETLLRRITQTTSSPVLGEFSW